MTITHIFFDLHRTLVDSKRLTACYAEQLGQVMAQRYGGSPHQWTQANLRILADWDSYFADLNIDEDIHDRWEGELRVTRALFRLTNTLEPPLKEIERLSWELPELATQDCDALYPDCKPLLKRLSAAGYTLGICSGAIQAQIRGTLRGGGVLDYFAGPLIGPDITEYIFRDEHFYTIAAHKAGVTPSACMAVDDLAQNLIGAKAAGMTTVQICREGPPLSSPADLVLEGDLNGLCSYLGIAE
ncbi:MAG: HAD family hydrolase [Anaerolineae bacterium]|nr:HAD family hydrolase [Anaerolineae bacterium]